MELSDTITLRPLRLADLDAVSRIDYSLLGKRRHEYWEGRLERAEASKLPSLAAEAGGEVIGFILGTTSGLEFGIPEDIGWIDSIGVAKEWQGKGVSKRLFKETYAMFKKAGVDRIYVFVDWKKWDVLQFFEKMGFHRGDMVNLQLTI